MRIAYPSVSGESHGHKLKDVSWEPNVIDIDTKCDAAKVKVNKALESLLMHRVFSEREIRNGAGEGSRVVLDSYTYSPRGEQFGPPPEFLALRQRIISLSTRTQESRLDFPQYILCCCD